VALPLQGTVLSYNGLAFSEKTTTKFTETPVFSEDGRMVKNSRLLIEVRGYITDDDTGFTTTDAYVETMRRTLSKPGRELIYQNRGAGGTSIIVNSTKGPIKDVAFGPKPGALKVTPLGGAPLGNVAALFEWSVETTIPECTNAVYLPGGGVFLQFAYSVEASIDDAGYLVLTSTGNFEIPLSLAAGGRSILDTADSNWTNAIGPQMEGFRRVTRRTLNPARNRIDFVTTDTQIPGQALPPDVVRADIRHRINNDRPGNIMMWTGTLAGSCTANPQVGKKAAWAAIYNVIAGRIAIAQQASATPGAPGGQASAVQNNNGRCVAYVRRFDVEDVITSDDFRFTVSYALLGASIADILGAAGMWSPIGTDWKSWHDSMANGPQHARGLRRWSYSPSADTLIDVCTGADPDAEIDPGDVDDDDGEDAPDAGDVAPAVEPGNLMTPGAGSAGDQAWRESQNFLNNLNLSGGISNFSAPPPAAPAGGGTSGQAGVSSLIDPLNSWVYYDPGLRYVSDNGQVRHKPMTGTVTPNVPDVDPLGAFRNVAGDVSDPAPSASASVPDIIQQNVSPSPQVILEGGAIRIGYKPVPPRLVQYGGIPLGMPAYEDIYQRALMDVGGIPVWAMQWRIVYLLPQPPSSLPTPANPQAGVDGDG